MGSKKHSKRDASSSSSEDSDSSDDHKKKSSKSESRRNQSREKRGSESRHRATERPRSSSGEQRNYKHQRSRSRSGDRRSRQNSRHDNQYKYHSKKENSRRNDRNEYTKRRRRSRSRSFDHANAKWGKDDHHSKQRKEEENGKAKPNFALSGKLTEETNTYRGVVIKYSEPPEARKPRRRWRLYPFKGDKALQTLYIHRESAYLIGRDRKVVDLPVDHPSCSKQHAALQYRLVPFTRDDGSVGKRVRPYLIDLESANGTFINNKKIDPKKYVELLERDVIKFGFSSREYVLLHENSKDEAMDDDVKAEDEVVKEEVKAEQE